MKWLRPYLRGIMHMGWVMTVVVAALLVIGVLFVYSACYISDEQPVRTLYARQIVWAVAGLAAYFAVALFDYERLRRLAWWFYTGVIVLLVLVLLVGSTRYGAQRWLMLFGARGIGFQPSELAKLAMVITLARRLDRPEYDLAQLRTLWILLAILALPILLIMKQPDLGTAMVFLPSAFLMMFVAGIPSRYLGSLALLGVTTVALVLGALFLPEKLGASPDLRARCRAMTGMGDYQIRRVEVFFHPDKDPLGAGWNKKQSEIAVGSGGAFGKGFLKGTQNILGFLPRSVAPTDFIYSVIAEEKGFAGAVVVIVLFAIVIVCGIGTAIGTQDRFGRLLCVGVVAMFFCHVFINIAMTVGLMPITGLPLPLLSYGGSFMVVTLAGLGLVQSVRIKSRLVESYR
jgi:rod shape determining protein RodA